MKKNVWQMQESSPHLQRSLEKDNGHLLVQVPKRSGILWKRITHKQFGIISRKRCWWNLLKAGVQFSVQRLHSPGVNSKAKDTGKLSIHFASDQETIETIFRIIVFADQLSLYGAHQNLLLQRYEERIKLLSQENKVSKFCMDAGFIHVVEIGQYFMTKDTEEQFFARACREYTPPRNDESSQPKGWIQGNTRIGPVLEITTSYLYGKHGIEIRIWSLRKGNSQSWVRISHGSNKFVIDSNYNNTEVPADLPEEQASQLIVKDFAARSIAKAQQQRREPVDSPSIIPMNERKWIDIGPGEYSLSAYEISKKVINLLRHSQTVQREDDGAVQFWRIKNYLQNQFPQVQYWSDDGWKACLAAGGDRKGDISAALIFQEQLFYLRALQGHSGRNLIDPSLQDNVIIQSGFCQHIYHIGCAFNLHSIINNGLIPGGRNSSKRQVFFLPIDPRDKGHQDLAKIDFTVPRRAQYLHSAWKKQQDAVFWVDINLAILKGLTLY